MLVAVKPNWKWLEDLYRPTPDDVFDKMSPEKQEELVTTHFHEYAPRNLKIRNKTGDLVPFNMNRSQLFFHWILNIQRHRTGKIRCQLLKGRQWGGSTYVQAMFYWETTKRFGCNTFIFSHEEKSTKTLFEMVTRFHQHEHKNLRPVTGKTNAQELVFPLLDSRYEMATAGKKDAARSKRITLLHWSEMASSPNADGHKKGLLQTVPDKAGTAIIKESTANGVGNTFHADWLEAVKGEEWEEIAVFVPWYWHDEYRKRCSSSFVRNNEEIELVALYGLDNEQLMFRRLKIISMKGSVGNVDDAFKQEYPMDWKEAFLFSGSNRFRAVDLKNAEEHLKKPLGVYSVDMSSRPYKLVPDPKGPLSIWEMPNRERHGLYAIGADVAKGLEHGDDSVACIVNLETGATSAEWTGKIPAYEFGDLLHFLGSWFGQRVKICVETTGGYGDSTVKRLQWLHYSHLYYTERRNRDGSTERRVGFDTTKNSKPKLIEEIDEDLINQPECFKSAKTVAQMGWFIRKYNETNPHADPKLQAQDGKHDDHVIARALASLLYHQALPREGRRIIPKRKGKQRIVMAAQSNQRYAKNLYRGFAVRTETVRGVKVENKVDITELLSAAKASAEKLKGIILKGNKAESWEEGTRRSEEHEAVNNPPPVRKRRQFGG